MALARPKAEDSKALQVGVVDPSLPAESGLENQFRDLYLRAHDIAMDHACRFLDADSASNAVHEGFARVWKVWTKLKPEQRSDGYVLRAIHNEVLKQLQRDERFVELPDAESELSHLAIQAIDAASIEGEIELADIIDTVIGDMPPRRKAVFLLVREQGMTYKEVAESLGISVASVNTHITLANESLRAGLTRAGFKLSAGQSTPALKPGTPEASNG